MTKQPKIKEAGNQVEYYDRFTAKYTEQVVDQELAIEDSQRRREYEREAKNEDNYWRQVQAETGLPVHHG